MILKIEEIKEEIEFVDENDEEYENTSDNSNIANPKIKSINRIIGQKQKETTGNEESFVVPIFENWKHSKKLAMIKFEIKIGKNISATLASIQKYEKRTKIQSSTQLLYSCGEIIAMENVAIISCIN